MSMEQQREAPASTAQGEAGGAMTSEEFFAFCQKRSNTGSDASKEIAVLTVWSFLWEQHPTKEEIEHFLDVQIREQSRAQNRSFVVAYTWLKELLTGGVERREETKE